jgi:four helix bundle protein
MKFKRFEDLECWQQARALTKTVYDYTKRPDFSKDFRLSGQITGAAISIMNNITEGFDSGSKSEFVRFLKYSRRSCSEAQNCLYVAMDQEYITTEEFQVSYEHCERIRKIVDGLIRYLRASQSNGLVNRRTGKRGTQR